MPQMDEWWNLGAIEIPETPIDFPEDMPDVLKQIIMYAKDAGCSDIHLAFNEYPAFRINGEITKNNDIPQLTEDNINEIIDYTVKNSDLSNIKEGYTDLDYCFEDYEAVRYRTNVSKKRGKYGIVMRILKNNIATLQMLQMPDSLYDLMNLKNGLILITGPTGSGKSSTAAALIQYYNETKAGHIITFEDPIEYIYHPDKSIVSQREIHKDTPSFADAIRASLREDPDVIFIGEMRDTETISAALTAAETGHLVIGTLHTTSAAKTIDRLVDVFSGDKQPQIKTQLATTLRAVISQVLIPTADKSSRVPAVEVMIVNDAIATYIRNNQKNMIESEIQARPNLGMISMKKSLDKLIHEGKIREEDANVFLRQVR